MAKRSSRSIDGTGAAAPGTGITASKAYVERKLSGVLSPSGVVIQGSATGGGDPWSRYMVIRGSVVETLPEYVSDRTNYPISTVNIPQVFVPRIPSGQFPVEIQYNATRWYWDDAGVAAGLGQPAYDHGDEWVVSIGGSDVTATGPEDEYGIADGTTMTFTSSANSYTCTYRVYPTVEFIFNAWGEKDQETGTHTLGFIQRQAGGYYITVDGWSTGAYYGSDGEYVMSSASYGWWLTLDDADSLEFTTDYRLPDSVFPLTVTQTGGSTLTWESWDSGEGGLPGGRLMFLQSSTGWTLFFDGGYSLAEFEADGDFINLATGISSASWGESPPTLELPAAQLSDRSVQLLYSTDASVTVRMPDKVPGMSRDFIVDVDNTGNLNALSIEFDNLGVDFALVCTESGDIAEITQVEAGARARLYFAETGQRYGALPMISVQRLTLGDPTTSNGE